ncbi:hypothetical protein DP117_15635 [Brasilonema sp. UFV-L1]|uniref:hypothetical protein n=1 Tax=Brasilonema sp. UFV-L1 TaxID=2234130 RepID=UPI0016A8860D|nr:hypothetical protein [Brasilonema sp. UFV-L1]
MMQELKFAFLCQFVLVAVLAIAKTAQQLLPLYQQILKNAFKLIIQKLTTSTRLHCVTYALPCPLRANTFFLHALGCSSPVVI